MSEIKYIYFEVKYISEFNSTKPTIENENVLLFKPNTNSNGIWGFKNVTERKGFPEPSFSIVEQYWIDFDKFCDETGEMKDLVSKVLERLNVKMLKN